MEAVTILVLRIIQTLIFLPLSQQLYGLILLPYLRVTRYCLASGSGGGGGLRTYGIRLNNDDIFTEINGNWITHPASVQAGEWQQIGITFR